jgi:hypothetical protein
MIFDGTQPTLTQVRAALDERYARAPFGRFQRRGHRGAAAADDGDVQRLVPAGRLLATAEPAARLVEQAVARPVGIPICDTGSIAQRGHRRHERRHGRVGGEREPGPALGVGHLRGVHAGNLLQGLANMRGARVAGHAANHEFGHGLLFERSWRYAFRIA